MLHYRFYVLDRNSSFLDVAEAMCANDEEAAREAEARLGRSHAIQIWQRGRFVSNIGPRAA